MSWDNEQKCPTLKEERVNLNQSAFSLRGNGGTLSLERRNEIKNLCLTCKYKICVFEYS